MRRCCLRSAHCRIGETLRGFIEEMVMHVTGVDIDWILRAFSSLFGRVIFFISSIVGGWLYAEQWNGMGIWSWRELGE